MNKSYMTLLLTVSCLFGLGISAVAQDTERVVVNVPFDFVAGTKTMPAGTYTIGRVSSDATSGIVVSSRNSSAFLLPNAIGESAGKLELSFEHIGDSYILSKVGTPGGVYTIRVAGTASTVMQTKNYGGLSSSSGAN